MNTVWIFQLVWMRVARRHKYQYEIGNAMYESDDVAAYVPILEVVPDHYPYTGCNRSQRL